ncbi:hypothetical protein [Paraburkholderia sacchari]|uniref:hypothetical protein n=1 Tax=Paraburkholderia sacchari TaxID=159450 RepID=UPI001BD057E0|nr:hypothetical protein [Paraburkholderia sacchari]
MSVENLALRPRFYPSIEALIDELNGVWQSDGLDAALTGVHKFVQACILDRRSLAKVFAEPALDNFCLRIGNAVAHEMHIARESEAGHQQADCVIVATQLYRAGGHTAVIEDLLNTGRFGTRPYLILTNAFSLADRSIVEERFGESVTGEVAPDGSMASKLQWLLQRLDVLRPRTLILMNHHQDPVAIAAAQPYLASRTVFYHHGDHQLCLGATLKHTMHVDPHPMGFCNCRDAIGIACPIYWPLIATDRDKRAGQAFMAHGALRTCSSGSQNKFDVPYKFSYFDVLPRVMKATGGSHVHIGPLSEELLDTMHAGLEANGVPSERFIHVPWVRSVWKALQSYDVDLYLASFPLGGGKVAIETMGAGIPIAGHDSYISRFLGGCDMFYREAFTWSRPEELVDHLGTITPEKLATESRLAREHYERFHTQQALVRAIDAELDAEPPPMMRRHVVNQMQSFLDDVHYALDDHLTATEIAPTLKRIEMLSTEHAVELEALCRGHELEVEELLRLTATSSELGDSQ